MQHTATARPIEYAPYTEPALGTREESVKAALKSHRSLERLRLNSRQTTATGVALRDWLIWLLDVWVQSDHLPVHQRAVVKAYFLTTGPDGIQRSNEEVAKLLNVSTRHVQRWKRDAIKNIADRIWPEPVK